MAQTARCRPKRYDVLAGIELAPAARRLLVAWDPGVSSQVSSSVPQIDELRSTGLHRADICPPGRNAGVPAGGVTAASGKGKQRGLSCGGPSRQRCEHCASALVREALELGKPGGSPTPSRGWWEELEGRFRRKHLDSRDLGLSLCRYAPNLRSPMAHSHRVQEEACAVVPGSWRIRLDDETLGLRTWDVIRVAPEVVRAFEAGPDGLEIIAFGDPKPEDGDGVRATSTWPGSE
jgi:hypothetical protein